MEPMDDNGPQRCYAMAEEEEEEDDNDPDHDPDPYLYHHSRRWV